MATIDYDSELMDNYVAATPISPHKSIVTLLHPKARRPALLGISNDQIPHLNLVTEQPDGTHTIIDLRVPLGLTNATVQAFSARQDSNLNVYLVVATQAEDTTKSQVWIVKPFSLDNIVGDSYKSQILDTVQSLYMGPPTANKPYPMLLAAHVKLGAINGGSAISGIWVEDTFEPMSGRISLPQDADQVLDICAASHPDWGTGIWALTSVQGSISLIGQYSWRDEDTGRFMDTSMTLNCPQGATCIQSVLEGSDRTGLLIGAANGLTYIDADTCVQPNDGTTVAGITISSDALFVSPQKLIATQDGKEITIWSLGSAGDIGYLSGKADALRSQAQDAMSRVVMLIPQHGSANFSPAISQPDPKRSLKTVSRMLISEDEQSNMVLLQQTMDTGIWKEEPFYVNDDAALFNIQSYTESITVRNKDSSLVVNGEVMLTASSTLTAINNGQTYTFSSLGTWVPLDDRGELNLIIATPGITGQSLTISGIRDSKKNVVSMADPDGFVVDPSRKAMNYFSWITPDTDLATSLRGQSGNYFWPNGDGAPDHDTLKKTAKCISTFCQSLSNFKPNGAPINPASAMRRANMRDDKADDFLMEGFHWIKREIDKVEDWWTNEIDGFVEFVVKIGKEIKSFVLDCVEKIGEAFTWLWNKIKLYWDELKDFCGFLFEWHDIARTTEVFKGIVNGALDFADSQLKVADTAVENFFDGLKQKFTPYPPTTSTSMDSDGSHASVGDSRSHDPNYKFKACKSTRVKWMSERLKNGGARHGTNLQNTSVDGPSVDKSWYDIFNTLGQKEKDAFKNFMKSIANTFTQNQSLTSKDFWSSIADDFVEGMLGFVEPFVQMLIQVFDKLVECFKDLLNKELKIPVISALYKLKTGNTLTFIEGASFIIGLPTCILIKLVTDKSPPDLGTVDGSFVASLHAGTLSDKIKADYTIYASAATIISSAIGDLIDTFIIIFKMQQQSVSKAVSWLQPGAVVLLLKSFLGINSTISSLATNKQYPDVQERNWAGYLGLVSIGSDLLFSFTPIGGEEAGEATQKCEMIDCILAVVNFALYDAGYGIELAASEDKFPEKDKALAGLGIVENYFKLLVSIGRNIAVQSEEDDPVAMAAGLAMMVIAREELDIAKTATFGRTSKLIEDSSSEHSFSSGKLITSPRGVSLIP